MEKRKRVVIKIGTKVIASKDKALDKNRIRDIADQISRIKASSTDVILVTSGAIGAGIGLLGFKKRPERLSDLQATASIGQSHLMHLYSEYFKAKGYLVGQILLTQDDFDDRKRYLNIKCTLETLIQYGAIPIINENDTVSTEEIRFGDNDNLARLVSDLCRAERLILLTDVDGLLDRDGSLVRIVDDISPKIFKLARASRCELGVGGMITKLEAAKDVAALGIECVIANGLKKDILLKVMEGETAGTIFRSRTAKHVARKRWIAYSSKPKGTIIVDDGAKEALIKGNKSLLASGITDVAGDFLAGDAVKVADREGSELARGITSYSGVEIKKIKGRKTKEISDILGYKSRDEVVHRDNLVIL